MLVPKLHTILKPPNKHVETNSILHLELNHELPFIGPLCKNQAMWEKWNTKPHPLAAYTPFKHIPNGQYNWSKHSSWPVILTSSKSLLNSITFQIPNISKTKPHSLGFSPQWATPTWLTHQLESSYTIRIKSEIFKWRIIFSKSMLLWNLIFFNWIVVTLK